MDRELHTLKKDNISDQISEIRSLLKSRRRPPQQFKIALSSTRETYYVPIAEIVNIVGENNYSTFHLNNGREIVVSKTLKEYEGTLALHNFMRVHKSHIINLDCIQKLKKGLEFSVQLSNGKSVGISYRRKAGFLKAMKESATIY